MRCRLHQRANAAACLRVAARAKPRTGKAVTGAASSARDSHAPSQEPSIGAAPMFYTSGTTGRPKGVRRKPMRPEQLAASARVGAIAYGIKPNEDQVILMNGPMYHSAPNSYGMLAFRHGCRILLVGFTHRLLRRVPPTLQILTHGTDRQSLAELLFD